MANQETSEVQQKHEKSIADYVGDMVALESHIEEALDRQLNEVEDDPEAAAAVRRFHDTVKQHRDTLIALQEDLGSTPGNPIKAAGAALLGKAAGVIDLGGQGWALVCQATPVNLSLRTPPEQQALLASFARLLHALAGPMQVLVRSDFRVPQLATHDLSGGTVRGTVSRGKHLLTRISADQEWTLHTHLKMEGAWQVYAPGERWRASSCSARSTAAASTARPPPMRVSVPM